MTAVIGILNKSAVAIAADSAVSVAGPKGPKIFNRANKIFNLSKKQPVGIMIYNHGEFMGTPWETIIKLYRAELHDKSFSTIEDYKNDFIKFLRDKNFFCDKDHQKKMLLLLIVDFLRNLLNAVIAQNQPLISSRAPDISNALARKLEEKIDELLATPIDPAKSCEEFRDFDMAEFDAFGFLGIPQAIQIVLLQNGIPVNPATLIPKIKEFTFRHLKSDQFFNYFSGLIFTGFGTDEIFPRLFAANVSIAINNRLKYINDEESKSVIAHNMNSAIRPFAQKDVIDTILAGTDPGLYNLYLTQFHDFITKNNQTISNLIRPINADIANRIQAIDGRSVTNALNQLISQERETLH